MDNTEKPAGTAPASDATTAPDPKAVYASTLVNHFLEMGFTQADIEDMAAKQKATYAAEAEKAKLAQDQKMERFNRDIVPHLKAGGFVSTPEDLQRINPILVDYTCALDDVRAKEATALSTELTTSKQLIDQLRAQIENERKEKEAAMAAANKAAEDGRFYQNMLAGKNRSSALSQPDDRWAKEGEPVGQQAPPLNRVGTNQSRTLPGMERAGTNSAKEAVKVLSLPPSHYRKRYAAQYQMPDGAFSNVEVFSNDQLIAPLGTTGEYNGTGSLRYDTSAMNRNANRGDPSPEVNAFLQSEASNRGWEYQGHKSSKD